jgi:hypothetical protein
MTTEYPKIWAWLPFISLGLMLVGNFAPVSDSWDETLSGLAIAVMFVWSVTFFWQERGTWRGNQSNGEYLLSWILPPVLAVGLLSLGTIAPISDLWDKVFSWVAFAILLAYVGVPLLEYHRERKADQSSGDAIASKDQV